MSVNKSFIVLTFALSFLDDGTSLYGGSIGFVTIVSGLNGTIPVFRKALMRFVTVKADLYAFPIILLNLEDLPW